MSSPDAHWSSSRPTTSAQTCRSSSNSCCSMRIVRVLVVDDQSPDGTGDLADELARQHPGRIEVMHRTGRRGLGRSYVDGFRAAIASDADVVCQMDADLSHDPVHLPALVAATANADLVLGSRYVANGAIVNWPLRRLLLSRFANRYIRLVTRLQVRDCTTRVSLLASRGPGRPAARSHLVGRLLVSGRDVVHGGAPGRALRRGADHVRRAAPGRVETVPRGAARIGADAVAIDRRPRSTLNRQPRGMHR